LKIGPKTSGSKHLLLFTEEIPSGAVIPKHKHHSEDEILLTQTGTAHVWLGDKEYDAQPGALVFIPAETWISLARVTIPVPTAVSRITSGWTTAQRSATSFA